MTMRTFIAALLLAALGPLAHGEPARTQDLILPAGVTRIADLPYGPQQPQRLDVYRPSQPRGPVLVLVHGGGWQRGDKAMPQLLDAKLAHWVSERGWILVSVDYRLAPAVRPPEQADDVAHAIAFVQHNARAWGADPDALVLMGHSAGAHLVALVSASPRLARAAGATPWRGTVVLDSAALDTRALMERPHHLPLYDSAFGDDPRVWRASSPTDALSASERPLPMLLVCSEVRPDDSCGQARRFADRVHAVGGRAQVLPQPLDHFQIDNELGRPGIFTDAVDAFIASLGIGKR
jgi:acetyl esterase/lipase